MMPTVKKILRILLLIFLILLALSGAGMGAVLNRRERPADNEIKIEMVDEKREDEDSEKE